MVALSAIDGATGMTGHDFPTDDMGSIDSGLPDVLGVVAHARSAERIIGKTVNFGFGDR